MYYVVQSFEFSQGPQVTLGMIVFDVIELPDPTTVKKVAHIHNPEHPGDFNNIFIYRYSNGHSLWLTMVRTGKAHVYDLVGIVNGNVDGSLITHISVPDVQVRGTCYISCHDPHTVHHPDADENRS